MRATLEVNPHRIAPRVKTARVNGTALTLTFDQSLKTTSTAATSAFTLGVGPIPDYFQADLTAPTITEVAVSGTTVTLTLNRAPSTAGLWRPGLLVSYTPPSSNALQH